LKGLTHSLILFGSYGLGHAGKHSDLDFLVLLKDSDKAKRLSFILHDYESHIRNGIRPVQIQIVDLTEKQIEFLFRVSSPLVHSARVGVVIRDDGYFRALLSKAYPKWPTKEYAVEAFARWIVWQYFESAVRLRREIKKDHGPEGWCTRHGSCLGHLSGDILARVISRMLYVTLPERGFMPLSKFQARQMAAESYGKEYLRAILISMAVLRKERGISFREFQLLYPFAKKLFRECLRICRKDPRVLDALKRNARIYGEELKMARTARES